MCIRIGPFVRCILFRFIARFRKPAMLQLYNDAKNARRRCCVPTYTQINNENKDKTFMAYQFVYDIGIRRYELHKVCMARCLTNLFGTLLFATTCVDVRAQ